jgi:hypothetical protein
MGINLGLGGQLSSTLAKTDSKADAQAILARAHCRRNVLGMIKVPHGEAPLVALMALLL